MKPPKEIISIEKKPEPPKKTFPLGRIVSTAIHAGYFIFIILFTLLSRSEEYQVINLVGIILLGPSLVGQYCDFHARGSDRNAHIERAIAAGVTCFEALIMITAVMAFGTLRAKLSDPTQNSLPKEYTAEDISEISVELSTGSNAPKYTVYTVDMESRTVTKETYSYMRGGEYTVTDTVSREFSEEKAAKFINICNEAHITKWDEAYLPKMETYEGLDEGQSFMVQYYSVSRGGYRKFSLDYKDGGSHMTVLYNNAANVPKYSGKVLGRINGLLTPERKKSDKQ